jgi:hypothetical protein
MISFAIVEFGTRPKRLQLELALALPLSLPFKINFNPLILDLADANLFTLDE